jgi:hypothetical protein
MQKLVFIQRMSDLVELMNEENYNLNPEKILMGEEA